MQCLADTLETATEAFTAVAGHQDQLALGIQKVELLGETPLKGFSVLELLHHLEQRVDDGIARDEHLGGRYPLLEQVLPRALGWREVQLGQRPGQLAVGLLRPGRIEVAGAQARLHMPHGDLLIVGGQGGGDRGRGIAVDQHDVRLLLGQHLFHALQDRGSHIGEVLAGLHDAQVMVGNQLEQFQHLVEHLAVLAGHAHLGVEPLVGGEGEGQWRHLDGFGTRAEHAESLDGHIV